MISSFYNVWEVYYEIPYKLPEALRFKNLTRFRCKPQGSPHNRRFGSFAARSDKRQILLRNPRKIKTPVNSKTQTQMHKRPNGWVHSAEKPLGNENLRTQRTFLFQFHQNASFVNDNIIMTHFQMIF